MVRRTILERINEKVAAEGGIQRRLSERRAAFCECGLVGTAYSGEGWLKLRDCFAFMVRSSSCNFAISAFCLWISLAASASCCTAVDGESPST
jgi:hypothetical protein